MRPGTVARKLFLSLVPLGVLLALTELLLWALGVERARPSLSRGFDPGARYFAPVEGSPGSWRTDFRLEPEVVPGKSARRRVLVFGGSNANGFPTEKLEEFLNAAQPSPGWEVFNLGRPGYGSERVSILVAQSLALLEPDVILVYSGHNEFVEGGFAQELGRRWSPWARTLAEGVSRLRLGSLLIAALEERPEAVSTETAGAAPPEPFRAGAGAIECMPLAETRRFFEAYRENLRRICAAASRSGVPLILCTLVSNDFSPPRYDAHPGERAAEAAETDALLERARALVPPRFRDDLDPKIHLVGFHWGSLITPEEEERRRAANAGREVPVLRSLTGFLARTPATHSARKLDSVEGAHWSDPAIWSDVVYERLGSLAELHARRLTEDERAGLAQALELYAGALRLEPTLPQATFELGICRYLLGDLEQAERSLRDAADLDRAPLKANRIVNETVRAVAAEAGAELLDCDALFREASPEHLIGYEVMLDVCHLHPGARELVMELMKDAVLRAAQRRSHGNT